jgi:hypothetical protein
MNGQERSSRNAVTLWNEKSKTYGHVNASKTKELLYQYDLIMISHSDIFSYHSDKCQTNV